VVPSTADEVIGLQQRLGRQTLDVTTARTIELPVPVAPDVDHVRSTQLCEMLRHRGRPRADVLSEGGDRMLTV